MVLNIFTLSDSTRANKMNGLGLHVRIHVRFNVSKFPRPKSTSAACQEIEPILYDYLNRWELFICAAYVQ